MDDEQWQHHTRSLASTQTSFSLSDTKHKARLKTIPEDAGEKSSEKHSGSSRQGGKEQASTAMDALISMSQRHVQEVQSVTSPTSKAIATTNVANGTTTDNNTTLKERAAKELQSKRITKLLDSTPFCGLSSEDVNEWLEAFSRKCDQVELVDEQRLIIATG